MESKSIAGLWEHIEQKLQDNNEPYQDVNAIYEFQIIDHPECIYQLEFEQGQVAVYDHLEKEAVCIFKLKEKHFRQFLKGDLNSTTSFMTGKLKVDGSIGLALKLENMLKKYDFSN